MRVFLLGLVLVAGCGGERFVLGDAGGADGGGDAGADATPAADGGLCPQGMARVDGPTPFCIDSVEVSVAAYTQFYNAIGGNFARSADCMFKTSLHPPTGNVAEHPVFNVDWCDAYAYCAAAGKRLCGRIGGGGLNASNFQDPNLSMWKRACTRGGMFMYPYGATQNASACRGGAQATPVASGSMATCEGGYPGIFDMVGNAQEWDDSCEGSGATANCAARGGDFMDPLGSINCSDTFLSQRQMPNARVGFRCCRD